MSQGKKKERLEKEGKTANLGHEWGEGLGKRQQWPLWKKEGKKDRLMRDKQCWPQKEQTGSGARGRGVRQKGVYRSQDGSCGWNLSLGRKVSGRFAREVQKTKISKAVGMGK